MCNRYHPTRAEVIEARWGPECSRGPGTTWRTGIGPWGTGPFIRVKPVASGPELVVGVWALIGDEAAGPIDRRRSTNNARIETVATLRTYRGPWRRGQRCLIPAERFDYPNWESGRNEWWTFARADGEPWHLAGIWNDWADPVTGEVFESYSMLTMNCDGHPLLNRFHKPDPSAPADRQDKRTVVPIDPDDHLQWLTGTVEQASELLRLHPAALYDARPDRIEPPSAAGEQLTLG